MHEIKHKPLDGLIRWGIVGCGDVTEIKSGPAFRKIPGSALVAIMRRDADKARDYAQRHGVPRWYAKADDLFTDPEIDAVYVASPPSAHLELGRLVAQAGKPCYVEKPMGASSADAQALIDVFADAGLSLYPAFYRRGLRKFRRIGELLAEGALGEIETVRYQLTSGGQLTCENWRLDPKISGGGLFVDLGSHVLDILDFWFGAMEVKSCSSGNRSGVGQVADFAKAALSSPKQPRIEIDFDYNRPNEHLEQMQIVTDKGTLSFAVFDLKAPQWEQRDPAWPSPSFDEDLSAEHVQQGLLENVMACLRRKAEPWATPQAAVRAWKLMEAVLKNGRS